MKIDNVRNCSFSEWYPSFRDVTFKSKVIKLPEEFVEYLKTDGVILPDSAIQNTSGETIAAPSFQEFEEQLSECIKNLGGQVFPKLNWSAPRDAVWVSFDGTLKCTCPSDIYLLLKSSEFISHDIFQPFDKCEDFDETKTYSVEFELILKAWYNVHAAYEFRCFVKNNALIAITQRHHTAYFEYIHKDKNNIISDIRSFHYHVIENKFPDSDYVFDVYRRDKGKLYLIDFNPFGSVTDGLLFTWQELSEINHTDNSKDPIFRHVESELAIVPDPYAQYAVPKDFVDLSSGEDAAKLIDLLQLKTQSQGAETSSDEENCQDKV